MLGAMREQEGRKKGAAPREGRGGGVCLTPPGREALLLLLPLSVFNAHHPYEGLGRRRPLRPPLSGVALVVSGRAGGSSGRKRRVQAMSVSADGSSKGGEAAVASAAATVMEAAFVTIKSIMAGGLAGMVAKSVVAPFDRVKILFQVSSEPFSMRKVLRMLQRIWAVEGLAGLWKGNSATMLRVFPYAGIQFMTFDAVKAEILRLQGRPHGQLSNVESLFAGSFAGFVSCTCTYPLDLARACLAVERHPGGGTTGAGQQHSVLYILRKAYQEGGVVRLYRGITPTLLGILPYAGIAFTINDKANHQIRHLTGSDPSTLEKLACGAFAGLIAQSATYPLDVVRRRMQTVGLIGSGTVEGTLYGSSSTPTSGHPPPARVAATSMVRTLMLVYEGEGFRGLFKGLSMNWIKGPVALGISFTTFDLLKRHLNVAPPSHPHKPKPTPPAPAAAPPPEPPLVVAVEEEDVLTPPLSAAEEE